VKDALEKKGRALGVEFHRLAAGLAPAVRVIPGREAALLDGLGREVARLTAACGALSAEIDAARGAAISEGRLEGYAEGRADAAALVQEALRFRRETFESIADEGIDLAFTVAAQLVGGEFRRDPALFRTCLTAWRDRACAGAACEIWLHPADASVFWGTGAPPEGVRVTPDETLSRGTCRIESARGVADAGVHVQIEEMRNAVR